MNHPHWKYFLSIESDIINLSKFIEITQDNFDTYSIELVRLFLSICSEIDVTAKLLCSKIDPMEWESILKKENNRPNIDTYRKAICKKFPEFYCTEIDIIKYGMVVIPWKDFKEELNPKWWSHHNNVKHQRDKNYKEANLGNVLKSAAGLLVLNMHLYADTKLYLDEMNTPKLFNVPAYHLVGGVRWEDPYISTRRENTKT